MPQATPIGGLSLFIHIIINVTLFIYRKFIKFFGVSNDNVFSNSFTKLVSKGGESTGRKFISYSMIMFVFVFMTVNSILVVYTFYKISLTNSISNKTQVLSNVQNFTPLEAVSVVSGTVNATSSILIFKVPSSKIITRKLESGSNSSLVDFMHNLGIVDISFEARAKLAKELGVTQNIDEYGGLPKQNSEIIYKLKDELNTYIQEHDLVYIN